MEEESAEDSTNASNGDGVEVNCLLGDRQMFRATKICIIFVHYINF